MTVVQNNKSTKPLQSQDVVRFQDLLYLCLSRWYWFVISIIVCLGVAGVYLLKTPPIYTRTAAILIKDDKPNNTVNTPDPSQAFSDFGLFTTNTNVNNEIGTLESPDLMRQVIDRLRLDMNYSVSGDFHKETLYGRNLPVTASISGLQENETASFVLQLSKGSNVQLSEFKRNGISVSEGNSVKGVLNTPLKTPIGSITVLPTSNYNTNDVLTIQVNRLAMNDAVTAYSKGLSVVQNDEKANIISLSFKDVSIRRAEDVLNTLIKIYNENWVKDKNQIAVSTSMFINDRLGVIENELGSVDNNISSYKSAHLLPDVQEAANMYMTQASEANASIKELSNQAYMVRYIRNYLANEKNKFQLLPTNSGIDNQTIASQISEYNKLLLERNSLVAQSGTNNPLVAEQDAALSGMRSALIHSIDNQLVSLNEQIRSQQGYSGQATSKIASNPKQAKYLLSVERQQKVKESLYLYLLQKREENELSQAFTAYNTRIITRPTGSMEPTAPVEKTIFAVAFMIGLLIPAVIIFMRENMNTAVRGRKDIENMNIPFAGEIPYYAKKEKLGFLHHKKKNAATPKVLVQAENCDVINEAFRVVRTNLEFMEKIHSVIMLTSVNAASGKTFITFNLASTLAIKGKKVIAIDLDLRKCSLSRYVGKPKTGISHYLSGLTDSAPIVNYAISDNCSLDIIPVGIIPPNPTELLSSGRLKHLLDQLREEYDYIFIDCPPVEILADADIINKYVDMTLFVIRSGLLDRSMLPVIDKYYTDEKYKNMAIILNGTDYEGSHYGYKYGYKYGYHYGYGNYLK